MSTNIGVAVIAASGSLSNSVKIGENIVLSVVIPSTWTSAVVTFQGSIDGTTFYELNDDTATAVDVAVNAGEASKILDPLAFSPWNYIKVRSGTKNAAVLQAQEAAVRLLLKENL